MIWSKVRPVILAAAFLSISVSSVSFAHGDPREMGAGPGVAAEAHHGDVGEHSDNSAAEHGEGGHDAMENGAKELADTHNEDMGSMESMGHNHDADNSDKSFGERLFIWLGKLHILVIHFPIAMIVAAFAAEAFGISRGKPDWRSAARIMLVIGALGAVVAAFLGWFAGGFYLFDRNLILTTHRYLGMTVAIGSVLLAWAGLSRFHHGRSEEKIFAGLLGLLTIGVLVQAFLGGTFMHGGMNHMNF